jgi:cytochrome P450
VQTKGLVIDISTAGETQNADFLAPEAIADPYPFAAELREHDPVHWSETHRAWLLTRYDDVVAAFNDPRMSSDRVKPLVASMSQERREKVGRVMERIQDWMVVSDPPEHTRLRKLVARAFSPRRIAASEQRIGELVDELLDEFIAERHTEFVRHFAFPLPATVIAELIGAPAADRDRFGAWSNDLGMVAFGAGGDARSDRHVRALHGLDELLAYFGERIEYARGHPGEDMISGLLEGDGDGHVLDQEEMESMCALMLFAGHETTTNLLSAMVLHLTRTPDQLALLRQSPELAGGAVEEILRYDGPIKILQRWNTEDQEMRGRTIRAGDRVFTVLAGANRDPERFPDPESIDITRSPNRHVAFGRGVHSCIGAQLSRIEGRVAVARIFDRLPGLTVPDQELEYVPTVAARALRELRVEHDAR